MRCWSRSIQNCVICWFLWFIEAWRLSWNRGRNTISWWKNRLARVELKNKKKFVTSFVFSLKQRQIESHKSQVTSHKTNRSATDCLRFSVHTYCCWHLTTKELKIMDICVFVNWLTGCRSLSRFHRLLRVSVKANADEMFDLTRFNNGIAIAHSSVLEYGYGHKLETACVFVIIKKRHANTACKTIYLLFIHGV